MGSELCWDFLLGRELGMLFRKEDIDRKAMNGWHRPRQVDERLSCQQDSQFVLCCSDEEKDGFTSISTVALVDDNNIDWQNLP